MTFVSFSRYLCAIAPICLSVVFCDLCCRSEPLNCQEFQVHTNRLAASKGIRYGRELLLPAFTLALRLYQGRTYIETNIEGYSGDLETRSVLVLCM
jgi:hypothetical protein